MSEVNVLKDNAGRILPSQRPMIYIAGPYAPLLNRTVAFNRAIADEYGRLIYKLTEGRCDIFIPHNCHAHWEEYGFDNADYFYSFDLRILAISEVIFMLPLWHKSKDSNREFNFAIENDIRTCIDLSELMDWYKKRFSINVIDKKDYTSNMEM